MSDTNEENPAEALAAMKKKLQAQGILKQQRVSFRKPDASAPADCISRIKSIIRSTLIHDFGYNYD